jgi:hypothetical protein
VPRYGIVVLVAGIVLIVAALASCWLVTPPQMWGVTTVDMIVYFEPGTPIEDQNRFDETVLRVPTGRGSEFENPEGLLGKRRCAGPTGSRIHGLCLSFARFASRDEIRAKAEAWPTVLKVLEDVDPNEVTVEDLYG